MAYGDSLGITLPTVGDTAWGGSLNTILQSIIDRLEAQVTTAGFNVDTTLELNNNVLDEINYLRLTNQTISVVATKTIWIKDGELYFVDASGNEVQLTSGGSINASALGGIGGDYTSSAATMTYTDANSNYGLFSTPGTYARTDVGPLHIHDATTAFAVIFASPGSLAADYTMTYPLALPSATASYITVDSTGTIAFQPKTPIKQVYGISSFVRSGSFISGDEHGFVHMGSGHMQCSLDQLRAGDIVTNIDAAYYGNTAPITVHLKAWKTGSFSNVLITSLSESVSTDWTTGSWGASDFPFTVSEDSRYILTYYRPVSAIDLSLLVGPIVTIERSIP